MDKNLSALVNAQAATGGPRDPATVFHSLLILFPASAGWLCNDGDALFPAIAIAPKVALVATLYSAVPAVIVSYGWLFLVEW